MRDEYQLILATVCRVTGFSETMILHDRRQLCVDARWLLVRLLSERMPCHEIAYHTGLSKQCVSQCVNQYAERARFSRTMQLAEQEVRTELRRNRDGTGME